MVFTAASSNEESLSSDYYDDDDSELHYKFTAFGRCKSRMNELFPWYNQDILPRSTDTSVVNLFGISRRPIKKCSSLILNCL
jgi:hypothetical protein